MVLVFLVHLAVLLVLMLVQMEWGLVGRKALVLGKLLEGLLVMVVVEGEHVHLHRHPASILNNWTLVELHTIALKR